MRKNLGWQNGWPMIEENIKARQSPYQVEPPELQACEAKGHKLQEKNMDPTQHGYDTMYFCDECGIEYHVDSSD